MFDSLVETFSANPYLGVLVIFLMCGMGLPLPEEIVLLAAGFMCYKFPERAQVQWMMAACTGSILLGDTVPFALGRIFGTRLLRIRWLRLVVTRRRLALFDRWFRKRGDMVILIARFIAGIRMVAFFTAGTMKMTWRRFLLLDLLGIVILVPPLVFLPYQFGSAIDDVIEMVQRAERGILFMVLGMVAAGGLYWWWRRRRKARAALVAPAESYLEPSMPPTAAEPATEATEGDSTHDSSGS